MPGATRWKDQAARWRALTATRQMDSLLVTVVLTLALSVVFFIGIHQHSTDTLNMQQWIALESGMISLGNPSNFTIYIQDARLPATLPVKDDDENKRVPRSVARTAQRRASRESGSFRIAQNQTNDEIVHDEIIPHQDLDTYRYSLLHTLSAEQWAAVSREVDLVALVYTEELAPKLRSDEALLRRADGLLRSSAIPGFGIVMFPCGCALPNAYFEVVPTRMTAAAECFFLPGFVFEPEFVFWAFDEEDASAGEVSEESAYVPPRVKCSYARSVLDTFNYEAHADDISTIRDTHYADLKARFISKTEEKGSWV